MNSTGHGEGSILTQLADRSLDLKNRADRQVAGMCVRKACRHAATDGDYCAKHGEEKREYEKRYGKLRRATWAKLGRCGRCGGIRKDGSRWCVRCLSALGKDRNSDLKNHAARVAAAMTPRTTASNLGRTHNHGQNKRGPMSRLAANRLDLESAAKEVARALDENDYAYSPEVEQLPKIQRMGERQKLRDRVYYAARFLLVVLSREGVDVTEMVTSLKESED